jgi:uncharacterized membrane protein
MWAYSSHYCYCGEGDAEHVSYDSGIVGVFSQDCRSRADDEDIHRAAVKYVGVLEGIYVVHYGRFIKCVMKGLWIPSNLEGFPIVKVDPYGFWLVRHAV